jgi:hypothetical protein
MGKSVNWLEVGFGAYLLLIGPEDIATGGTTILPSAAVGAGMIAHGLGVL